MTAERADRRRLDDHRVAGHQGGTGGAGDERRRIVERGDHRPHAVRAHHVGGDLAVAEAQHRHVEAGVLGHRVRVVANQVGCLLDLPDRLQPRLAVFPGERCPVDDGTLGDQVGGPVEDFDALTPGGCRPGRVCRPRRADRFVDVGRRRGGKCPDDNGGVDRRHRGEPLTTLSVTRPDAQWVELSEPAAHVVDGGRVGRLQLLVVRRQGGVGDAKGSDLRAPRSWLSRSGTDPGR